MITEAVANWFLTGVAAMVGLLPEPSSDMVAASGQYTGSMSQVINQVANLGPIVPFGHIAAAAGILAGFLAFALVLQVSRIVISISTLGGGSV